MPQPSTRERQAVDEAVRSVQALPFQAMKVQTAVVPQANNARKSLDESVRGNSELLTQSRKIAETFSESGIRFVLASRGHEGPDQRMYGQRHAQMDSMDRFQASARQSRQAGLPFRDGSGLPNQDFVVNLPAPRYAPSADQARNRAVQRDADEVRGWLTPGFLGDAKACERMNRSPSVFTVENRDFFVSMDWRREGAPAIAFYISGTNHIAISEGLASDRAMRMESAAHEQLHYAAYLGGGQGVRWMDENQKPVVKDFDDVRWIHEGMTELIAQQLVRSKGYTPKSMAYPSEVLVASYIANTLDEAAGAGKGGPLLRTAYTTGDFTRVRSLLDSRLGKGTFERLIGMRRGADALSFMEGEIPKAKRDAWDAAPENKVAREELASAQALASLTPTTDAGLRFAKGEGKR
jgi:hypothetical protein